MIVPRFLHYLKQERDRDPVPPPPPQHPPPLRILLRRVPGLPHPRVRPQGRVVQVPQAAAGGQVRGEHLGQVHQPDGQRSVVLSQQEGNKLNIFTFRPNLCLPGHPPGHQAREPAAGRQGQHQDRGLRVVGARAQQPPRDHVRDTRLPPARDDRGRFA